MHNFYLDKWRDPGLSIWYEHSFVNYAADFLKGLETSEPCTTTFEAAPENIEGVPGPL